MAAYGRIVAWCFTILLALSQSGADDPTPDPRSVVQAGNARFTVITDGLIRLEYDPMRVFVNSSTMTIVNRKSAVPVFSVSKTGLTTTITTAQLVLSFIDDGNIFNANNLNISLKSDSFWTNSSVWNPSMNSLNDPGNLFGTFHNLDTLSGMQNLNCSQLQATFEQSDAIPFYPCDMGLISKSGWALVDESRAPVFLEDDWLHTRLSGTCAAAMNTTRLGCSVGQWSPASEDACAAAGCCWDPVPVTLNLFYSAERLDHFTDHTCDGCDGSGYVFVRAQGRVLPSNASGTVALNLYWNPAPSNGRAGSNVVSTSRPPAAGYSFVRTIGFVHSPAQPQPAGMHEVKLWHNAAQLDFYTTMCDADEDDAVREGFVELAVLGYSLPALPAPSRNSPLPSDDDPPSCFQRGDTVDWYFFGHGLDYAGALRDYALVAGPPPIPRRHFLGISWSKWGNTLTQNVTYQQVASMEAAGLPLDTYIFDMNWHLKPDWTGYTWDAVQYPDHVALLQWLHARGLSTAANLHDAEGVMAFEAAYPAMARANGIDPATRATVEFDIGNKTFSDTLTAIVLDPLAREGLDFWWTDFQQGLPGVAAIAGVTPTLLLNRARFTHDVLGRRGLTHSRYGGRGSHRYDFFPFRTRSSKISHRVRRGRRRVRRHQLGLN